MAALFRELVQQQGLVDINHADNWGRTPLMWQCMEKNDGTHGPHKLVVYCYICLLTCGNLDMESINALIESGASVTKADQNGLTALHLTLLYWREGISKRNTVEVLLRAGADPTQRSVDGLAPRDIVRGTGVERCWEQLLATCGMSDAMPEDNEDTGRSSAVAFENPAFQTATAAAAPPGNSLKRRTSTAVNMELRRQSQRILSRHQPTTKSGLKRHQ